MTLQKTTDPPWELSFGFRQGLEQERLSRLGCQVVACDAFHHFGSLGSCVLSTLIPQFSCAIPSVNAATAALGSVYSLQLCSPDARPHSEAQATQRYLYAIQVLQEDLREQRYGPLPLLMACTLLCFSELIMHKPDNALLHLMGAYKLLEELQVKGRIEGSDDGSHHKNDDLKEAVALMFRFFDYEACTFALPRPPDLPALEEPLTVHSMTNVGAAWATLIPRIHASYHTISRFCEYKYCPQLAPREAFLEQGRHIGQLTLWLEMLDHDLLPQLTSLLDTVPSPALAHALILRITCLTTLIVMSTFLTAEETVFDTQASRFQQIVTDASRVLASKHHNPHPITLASGPRFTPGPGVIYPLIIVGAKYRNSKWRHRALDMLRCCGREGPYFGPRAAKVVQHIIDVEETWEVFRPTGSMRNTDIVAALQNLHLTPGSETPLSSTTSNAPSSTTIHPSRTYTNTSPSPHPLFSPPNTAHYPDKITIPESSRIAISGFDRTSRSTPTTDILTTKFLRCRNIRAMVAASDRFVGLSDSEVEMLRAGTLKRDENVKWEAYTEPDHGKRKSWAGNAEEILGANWVLPPKDPSWWEIWEVQWDFLAGQGVEVWEDEYYPQKKKGGWSRTADGIGLNLMEPFEGETRLVENGRGRWDGIAGLKS